VTLGEIVGVCMQQRHHLEWTRMCKRRHLCPKNQISLEFVGARMQQCHLLDVHV
jgi:hypothetical protein